MPRDAVVVAIDQGTSSTKVITYDQDARVRRKHQIPVHLQTPAPGWVEQDPNEILAAVLSAANAAVSDGEEVLAVGLSNQRESALAWETATGRPLGPMLGWQDRRTAPEAERLLKEGVGPRVREVSGLPLDPMFSALKMGWLLDQVDPDRARAKRGEITLGTLDSWLMARLCGERRIEIGNASRTQLLDVEGERWHPDLLELFDIPERALPGVVASDEPSVPIYGTDTVLDGARVGAVMGDSHAALFAHGARRPGVVKVTYGTGSSVMGLVDRALEADTGLAHTIAWKVGGQTSRAAEGNILSVGATLVWMSQLLEVSIEELAVLARTAPESDVVLVPAFDGLGAPWWDDRATAVLVGFGLGTGRASLARAAFDSIPMQVEDVLSRVDDSGVRVEEVLVDGGPTANEWLMQLQADVAGRVVVRSELAELSGTGVAHVAGISAGLWTDADLDQRGRPRTRYTPQLTAESRAAARARWHQGVLKARSNVR